MDVRKCRLGFVVLTIVGVCGLAWAQNAARADQLPSWLAMGAALAAEDGPEGASASSEVISAAAVGYMYTWVLDYGTDVGPGYSNDFDAEGGMHTISFSQTFAGDGSWAWTLQFTVAPDIEIDGSTPYGDDISADMERYDLEAMVSFPVVDRDWIDLGMQFGLKLAYINKDFDEQARPNGAGAGIVNDSWDQESLWAGPMVGLYAMIPLSSLHEGLSDFSAFGTLNTLLLYVKQDESGRLAQTVNGLPIDEEFSSYGVGLNSTLGLRWRATDNIFAEVGYRSQFFTAQRGEYADTYQGVFGSVRVLW